MNAVHSKPHRCIRAGTGRGFTMTELLVVIGIITVLAGILLVAMRGARERGLYTQTQSTMQSFMSACDAFQIEHGSYPGVVPETILAQDPQISGTENALLQLMGGYRVLSPFDDPTGPVGQDFDNYTGDVVLDTAGWKLKVDVNLIGDGPMINGKPYAPYFTPGGGVLGVAQGQVGAPGFGTAGDLPDLLDTWGQPMIFVRSMRSTGPLVGDPLDSPPPQFSRAAMTPYTESTALGEFGKDQTAMSILTAPSLVGQDATFAQIIRHPGFGAPDEPLNGTARGAYVLISAGPDGIYFSRQDGPGSPKNAVSNIVSGDFGNPRVVEEYDDVRRFGGG